MAQTGAGRVLVIQTAFLGDALLAVPLLEAIRRELKPLRLGIVVRKGVGEILKSLGVVDEVIEIEKSNSASRKSTLVKVKNFRPDVLISPHQSLRSAILAKKSGAPVRVGFKRWFSFLFYNRVVARPDRKHDVLRQLSLLESLGVEIKSNSRGEPPLYSGSVVSDGNPLPRETGFTTIREAKQSPVQFAVIAPGSQWATKQWTEAGFSEVGRSLSRKFKVIVVGTASEKERCAAIAKNISGSLDLSGKTSLVELHSLMNISKIVVCNDSGSLHLATIAGVPTVAIFGPTTENLGYFPWSKLSRVVQVDLACRPCGKHGHQECPIKTHACMNLISPEMVLKEVKSFVSID